jgi:site-specific DNA recombinase
MATAKSVKVIPATRIRFSSTKKSVQEKRKVAAYARVSTGTEEQFSSYEAQVDYYTRYIQEKEGWDFVKVYTDEGISATSTKKRNGFNRMIHDALAGKIDLIVTKSVSRFARNTVDTLSTVRKLKEKGVEVYFEKENIYTMDSKGELLITIMSSLAQEESRSISENVTWGQRKRFADGKVSLPYGRFLGYEKGEDDLPKIVESEAKIVRLIYKLFLEGKTPSGIAKYLTTEGIPTPSGKRKWQYSTVKSIITNEKYKGDAILQKSFTVDFLTKKTKSNEGEVPQYYVENSHPAIIEPDVFEMVQYEMKRRKENKGHHSGASCFSSKIVCGECGSFYGSKVWHSTSKYRRTIWQCNHKFKGDKCSTPHFDEKTFKQLFVDAFNQLITNRDEIAENCRLIKKVLTDTYESDKEVDKLQNEIEVVSEMIRQCVEENAQSAMDQEEYNKRYNGLAARYEKIVDRLEKVEEQRQGRHVKQKKLETFISALLKKDMIISEFDETLWHAVIDKVTVYAEDDVKFTFKDGTVIRV